MMKRCFLLLCLSVLLLASCGTDDYYYPSVRLEFLTAVSGTDGLLATVTTDDGHTYPVLEDVSHTSLKADTAVRIISNCEVLTADDGTEGVKLYALASVVSPLPQSADYFKEGVKDDAADVQSIWMGYGYLNMLLGVQAGTHVIHFVEEEVVTDAGSGHTTVKLSLYHDAGDNAPSYTVRVYASVPLWPYLAEGVDKLTLHFSLKTSSGEVKTYLFDYIPAEK